MRKVTKEQIINWFEAKGIREQFEKNHKSHMSRLNDTTEDEYSLDKYLDGFMRLVDRGIVTMNKLISGGFAWVVSPEGHMYWWKIEEEFNKWLSEDISPVKDSSPDKTVKDSPEVVSRVSTTATVDEICDLFKAFLENRGTSVAEFEDNLKHDFFRVSKGGIVDFKAYVEDQCKRYTSAKDLVSHGFVMEATPQGWQFWSDLSLDWEEFCEKHKI